MRLRVNVNRPDKAQKRWTVTYANPELAGVAAVTLSAVKDSDYPVIKPAAPSPKWNEKDVAEAAKNVATKQVDGSNVETFGRHLFDVLIGTPLFASITATGTLEAIEICSDDPEFSQLPWEMLWLGDDFAARKGVGVVRIVPAPAPGTAILLEPKVLFVVGSDLNDARIRPGAEYLGLIRRLEQENLHIESHVLARATPKKIEDAIQELRPSVVHFICHGGGRRSGSLELVSDDPGKSFVHLTAEQLADLTRNIPKVIVMNACESGKPSLDSHTLALSVASRGTPVVVGMAGRVADRACRLFTRRFYEALVTGAAVDAATAAARKDAMTLGIDPRLSVDWAMPTLFMHDGVRLRLDPEAAARLTRRAGIARHLRVLSDPGLVCGRGECLDAHRNLLDGREADRPRVLVLKVVEHATSIQDAQYGKTRIVQEIAASAALRGHLPCVLTFPSSGRVVQAPKTAQELATRIAAAIDDTRGRFGLNQDVTYEVLRVPEVKARRAAADSLSPAVRSQLQFHPFVETEPEAPLPVIRAALTADLESLAAEARAAADDPQDLKVVVFLDDVHACSAGGRALVEQWLNEHGLGRVAHTDEDWAAGRGPIPVVLTYSSVTLDIYKADVDALRTHMEARSTTFRTLDLKAFDPPGKDPLPYHQFLLSRAPMLVISEALPTERRKAYLDQLYDETSGVPSRLTTNDRNRDVHVVIKLGQRVKDLEEADDELALKQLVGGGK